MREQLNAATKIAIYARYSTEKQSESSIADQVAKCRAYVEARGGAVRDALVFHDEAVSGSRLNRPGFNALMAAVTRGEVEVIVAEDLERISRRMADSARWLEEIQFKGVTMLGVNDGTNTSDENATMSVGVRAVFAQQYIEDVRKRTHRGMTGIAKRGHSTGKLPLGYTSCAGVNGERAIVIDEAKTEIVRRIFALRMDGKSIEAIARALNQEGTAPPHGNGKRKRDGWVASSVRAILRNEKYVGRWTWNERKYVRPPDSDKRVSRKRDESEIVRLDRPDLRIVDDTTWSAVRAMERKRTTKGPGDGRGRRPKHLFSGLLACAECGGPMIVTGGSEGRRYYACDAAKKRGTCKRREYMSEPLARTLILADLREAISTPSAAAEIRRLYAEHVGDANRLATAELRKRTARLADTERRIAGLILMQAAGDASEFVVATRRDLEAHARTERAAIETTETALRGPVRLPTIGEVEAAMRDLDGLLEADVDAGREALRRLLAGERIRIEADGKGGHVAKYDVFPLAAVLAPQTTTPPGIGAAWSNQDCGGPKRTVRHVAFEVSVRAAA